MSLLKLLATKMWPAAIPKDKMEIPIDWMAMRRGGDLMSDVKELRGGKGPR